MKPMRALPGSPRARGTTFDSEVERALTAALAWPAETGEDRERRLKALGISVKWCAVKAKIVTTEHGSGLIDDDDDDLTGGI